MATESSYKEHLHKSSYSPGLYDIYSAAVLEVDLTVSRSC